MVKMQGKDQEALDKALKEIAEATKDVTFPPSLPPKK
jgi:CRISPR/Cas system-associated exonuclease Cas4 (RecB family)